MVPRNSRYQGKIKDTTVLSDSTGIDSVTGWVLKKSAHHAVHSRGPPTGDLSK